MTAPKVQPARPPLKVFVQVRPETPPSWWSKTSDGWVTLARDGALGGWTADLDPTCLMTITEANAAIKGWLADHTGKDADGQPEKPWHYRVIHVENLGLLPVQKGTKKTRATKAAPAPKGKAKKK